MRPMYHPPHPYHPGHPNYYPSGRPFNNPTGNNFYRR
jgi:hypothetical protein